MPPDAQNIINPSGKGNINEIVIDMNFPSHSASFFIFLALSNFVRNVLTRFGGKGKKKQVVKFLLTILFLLEAAERRQSLLCSWLSSQSCSTLAVPLSDSAHLEQCVSHTVVLSVPLNGKHKGPYAVSCLPGVLEK